jgi:hypothetical protein
MADTHGFPAWATGALQATIANKKPANLPDTENMLGTGRFSVRLDKAHLGQIERIDWVITKSPMRFRKHQNRVLINREQGTRSANCQPANGNSTVLHIPFNKFHSNSNALGIFFELS